MAALSFISRHEAIAKVCSALAFPWELKKNDVSIADCLSKILDSDLSAASPLPPFTRSTRDGFAVRSVDVCGASSGAPVFLSCVGEIKMGETSELVLAPETCAKIHTGGIVPSGADAVLMLEDAQETAGFVEARRAVQGGENVIFAGEEYNTGDLILPRGHGLGFASIGALASMGIKNVGVSNPVIGILSTGDEIVDSDTAELPAGKIRDVNSLVISAVLKKYGYASAHFGIVGDDKQLLREKVAEMSALCDVILLSGGSSVSERDNTEDVISEVSSPGLIVKGIRIVPGKPTLIAGSRQEKKLLFGLPGHPLSCLTVMITVVLPLFNAMQSGVPSEVWTKLKLKTKGDIFGRTGVEEFIPCDICDGEAVPMPSKSGYVAVNARGFVRLADNIETVRTGEEVEVLLWN